MNRRRFLFLGVGVLATGAVDPLSLIQRPPPYGSTEWALSEDLGPSIVLSFRDDLTPSLRRFQREMIKLSNQIRFGSSPGGIMLLPRDVIWSTIARGRLQ